MKKAMRLRHRALTLFALMMCFAAPAQIYIMEDEENEFRNVTDQNGPWNNTIIHGIENDQTNWAPVGNGILLLTTLGSAYLLKKKKSIKSTNKS